MGSPVPVWQPDISLYGHSNISHFDRFWLGHQTVSLVEISRIFIWMMLTGAKRREWMGMGVAGIIFDSYCGSFPHSLLSTSKDVNPLNRFVSSVFPLPGLSCLSKHQSVPSSPRVFRKTGWFPGAPVFPIKHYSISPAFHYHYNNSPIVI